MPFIDVAFDREDALEFFRDLVKIPSISPPGDEAPVADRVAAYFADCPDVAVEFQPLEENRKNVSVTLKGSGEKSAMLLNGHLDVVGTGELSGWDFPPFDAAISDGSVIGRGTGDMKGGLAALAAAMKLIARDKIALKGDLVLLGTCGEEVDGCGARAFIASEDMSKYMCTVIAEPTGSVTVSSEKGLLWVEFTARGVPAHGSVPETGVNAIEHLMELLSIVKRDFNPASVHPALGRTSMNLGTISGGDRPNMVPDIATAAIDFRTVPGYEKPQLLELVENSIAEVKKAHPDADISYAITNDRMLVATPDDHPMIALAVKLNGEMGLSTAIEGKVAVTDASILNTVCDTPMLIYGAGKSSQAHVYNEYMGIDDYYKSIVFYYNLIIGLLG